MTVDSNTVRSNVTQAADDGNSSLSREAVARERDHFREMQAFHQAGADKRGTTLVGFHDAGLALAYGLCADKLDLLLGEGTRRDAERSS